ncbi:uncharacterized protein PRCAT00005626001 [Priceomyces carsonii]|uniref:uncharacterized protein n=1 Tax=Priceomyces carsonii TaxID=28549 RepID=UPI002ED89249|nr:unnamed protein product [Priceomyces carsonii]
MSSSSVEMNEQKPDSSVSQDDLVSDRQNDVLPFEQPEDDESRIELHSLAREQTLLERVQTSYSFFNEKLRSQRFEMMMHILLIYLVMATCLLSIFSIYWGSMYKRETRMKNLKMLVVIEDDHTIGDVKPWIGDEIKSIVRSPDAKSIGDWHVYNSSEFHELAEKHDNNIEQELARQIHHQKFWSSIYVKPNATYNLYKAMLDNDSHYNVTNGSIISVYETGRDFLNMNSYVTPAILRIQTIWQIESAAKQKVFDLLPNKTLVLNQEASMALLTSMPQFAMYDNAPFMDLVLVAPSQVGLIYLIIVTFFQFNFFQDLNQKVAKYKLKKLHYVLYRIIVSVLSFFVLSLFYSFVSLAMQVDFQKAFGRSGFLVYWMTSFLTMWSVGLLNEIMALVLIMIYPPLIGFWMLFWVIINISPTFTPLALSPKFFRYGYGLPIHNSYEITKVIFFNTYKGQLGRNYGILVAWIVLEMLCYPFVLKRFGQVMAKKAQKAAQAQEK